MSNEILLSFDYNFDSTAEYEEEFGHKYVLIKDDVSVHNEETLLMETSLEVITAIGLNEHSDDYIFIRFMTEIDGCN